MATESINAVKSRMKNIREWVTPARTSSAFLSKGVLTPEEFVKAGDELVFKCPTWSWEGGDPSKARSILPKDKQFLITRNVPCSERVQDMEQALLGETEMELANMLTDDAEGGGDDKQGEGWMMSHLAKPGMSNKKAVGEGEEDDDFDFVTMDDEDGEAGEKRPAAEPEEVQGKEPIRDDEQVAEAQEDDEYGDMADFEDGTIEQDDAMATATETATGATGADDAAPTTNNIRRVRTYDISITYDKYYQTPRVWIFGYREEDSATPLTSKQMFEDVMSDYVQRTVTIETHPHTDGPHLSIHPCQHGAVMKNIVRNLTKKKEGKDASSDDADAPSVEMYLFIFLKFVSSIIPTMNYDFTFDVTASTQK